MVILVVFKVLQVVKNLEILTQIVPVVSIYPYSAFYTDENIFYFNSDSGNVVFSCNEIDMLNIGLNNINLDKNFDKDDPDTKILIRILAWHIKFEKRKTLKKKISEELMSIAWDGKISDDEKKEKGVVKVCVGSIQYEGIETFWDKNLSDFFGQ